INQGTIIAQLALFTVTVKAGGRFLPSEHGINSEVSHPFTGWVSFRRCNEPMAMRVIDCNVISLKIKPHYFHP
ncbi:hypothetical protein, partial [Acinetobacter baumannii]|uniref:hypothetical protein n=1 Tax=Acinetobacter baumannii TaxID=470 RepID=UPI0028700C2A